MSVALDQYLDQQRCDEQDEISQDLYIQGCSDGYQGIEKTCFEQPYVMGYEQGLSNWIREERVLATVIDDYVPF